VRWIAGDLQGCARELEDLLETIRFDRGRDELWTTGDLINRGPDSLRTLEIWRDVGGRSVVGNHEVYALLAHSGRVRRKSDTLDALFASADVDAWMSRLRALPMMAFLPGDRAAKVRDVWVVHGGIDPRWSDLHAVAARVEARTHDDAWLESEEVSFSTRVRSSTAIGECAKHDGAPEGCPPPSVPWNVLYDQRAATLRDPALVVHGHWAWRGHYRTKHVIGLDSGCVYGRGLTAWAMEEDRIVVVPSHGFAPRTD